MSLARVLLALDAPVHLHRVAGDDVADRIRILLRGLQRAAVFRGAAAGLVKLALHVGLLALQGSLALVHLVQA